MFVMTDSEGKIIYDRLVERLAIMKIHNLQHPSKEGDEAEKELEYILDKIADCVDVS